MLKTRKKPPNPTINNSTKLNKQPSITRRHFPKSTKISSDI